MSEVRSLSWDDFHHTVNVLAIELERWAQNREKPQICAIARGGLVAATILSHALKVPVTNVIFARTYSGKKNLGTELDQSNALPLKSIKDTIFVDDILDTGSTVDKVAALYPNAMFAIPIAKHIGFAKHRNRLVVAPANLYADQVWVKFPWETA